MEIITQIENHLSQAAKDKDQLAVLTLRGIKTALTNAEIAKNREPLADDQVIKVLRTEVKRRQEAAELYQKGGRDELAQKEQKEIEIIKKYLPAEMSDDQIRGKVKEAIGQVSASGPQDMGKVMGLSMALLKGQADGSTVSKIVSEELKNLG